MDALGITCEMGRYRYETFYYDSLVDAVRYARTCASRTSVA